MAKVRLFTWLFILFAATAVSVAYAEDSSQLATADSLVSARVRAELAKRYPGARIELTSPIQWIPVNAISMDEARDGASSPSSDIVSVQVGDENARGETPFNVQSRDSNGLRLSWGRVSFAAYLSARVASRRLLPGEAITPELFVNQEINVAFGPNHEIRGLIFPSNADLGRTETRQTILEGQPLLSTEIERIPDVRRGDPVRIELVSGSLTVSTLGTASEPGYVNGELHVMSQDTKRALIGTLLDGGIVEVRL